MTPNTGPLIVRRLNIHIVESGVKHHNPNPRRGEKPNGISKISKIAFTILPF
jgi:hypothetical protein